ncbi:MAG: hypothetical protein RL662_1920 [Bacteroidota bacterium]|jgi:hypothetical protein
MAKNMYDIEDLSMQPSTDMEWFTHAIFGGKLIERGKITPVMGVKDETLINLIDLNGGILQADKGDCGWTPDELFKLAEKPLKVKTYKINKEQCLDDLERKRIIWALSPGAKNTELPDSLERASMELLAIELSNEIEVKVISGDKSKNADDFDGMSTILIGSADSIKIAGVALTKANILEEISKVFEAIPEAVLAKGLEENSLNIFMSYESLTRVKLALATPYNANVVISPNFTVEGVIVKFMGIELVPVKGLTNSQMIAIDVKNSLLGTDLLSDTENVRLGQFPAPNDSKIFIDGRLRLGFVIPFEDEAVIYDPTVTTTPLMAPLSAPTVFQGTADEVIAYVKTVEDLNELKALLDAENAGKKRSTVIQAINARVDEISNV